ncbi:MAG: hypothetical protein JNL32_13975, partial [Candidatus Kapabacteria bacterium]|nr:hypothetical protein [Candidatus Kapabacteria bacterium]
MRSYATTFRTKVSGVVLAGMFTFALFLSSCQAPTDNPFTPVNDTQEFEADGATAWMDVIMSAVRTTPGFTPPVAARAYGYAGITMWESVVHGTANGRSLSGQINSFSEMPLPEQGKRYHWVIVMNAAMAEYTRSFFPMATDSMKQVINALETRLYNERRNMGIGADILEHAPQNGQHTGVEPDGG